jgi:hypothetical protein
MKPADFILSSWSLRILLAAVMLLTAPFAAGQNGQVLYRFRGPSDGYNPYGNVIFDQAGNLYGTVEYGGVSFYGAVFLLAPPAIPGELWKKTTLYTFHNIGDGARPTDGLIFDHKGSLYGTTSDSDAGGYGEIFQLSPPAQEGGAWTESVLYHFQGKKDGAYPVGGLVWDQEGNLYGASDNTVFELSPPTQEGGAWTFTVLHRFTGGKTDGNSVHSALLRDKSGNLYGTTLWGGYQGNPDCGEIGCGTAFEVSPPAAPGGAWSEQLIHIFGMKGDGFNPEGGLALDASGNLYGTTYSGGNRGGGGTAFQLTPPSQPGGSWTESIIHSFSYSQDDGAAPVASMIFDKAGNLYGTTLFGGNQCLFDSQDYGCGVVFELSPVSGSAWNETILYYFPRRFRNPRQSAASLIFDKQGNLYGTSVMGGYNACIGDEGLGCGTVFEIIR